MNPDPNPNDPHRRRADDRPQKPALIAPTPAPGEHVPDEVCRSIDLALERARAGRRAVTLMSVSLPDSCDEAVFERLCDALRAAIRSGDGLWREGPRSLVALLADLDGPGAPPAFARFEGVLRSFGDQSVEIGRASAPPGIGALDLLDLARVERRPLGE